MTKQIKEAFENHWYERKNTAIGSSEAMIHFEAGWNAHKNSSSQSLDDERVLFEKWFIESEGFTLEEYPLWNTLDQFGQYRSPIVHESWIVWLARSSVKFKNDDSSVIELLSTGEWKLIKIIPAEYLTDEYNKKNAWMVERQLPPFCNENGERVWTGSTPIDAFQKAISSLKNIEQ